MKTNKALSLLKIGTITRAHGIKGDVFVKPFNPYFDWPHSLTEIFIGEDQAPPSFSVESYSPHKNGCIFKLKNVSDRDQSLSLKGKPVFFNKKDFLKNKDAYLFEYIDFTCEIKGRGVIGKINSFQSSSHQDYLVISREKQKEILIPFVQTYIESIDHDKKNIILNVPENFFEMFDD